MASDDSFITCGVEIPLRDLSRKPSSITITHTIPENLNYFATQRPSGDNFDVTVIVGDEKLKAHKELLSARIPFFKALFDANMLESAAGEVDLSSNMNTFDFVTVENLLDYAYTGLFTISEASAQALVTAAHFFQLDSIVNECLRFVKERILFDNILPLITLCRSINHDIVDDTVRRFIDKNFVPISETPEFLDLSVDEIADLLERDSLNVDNEEQVFEAFSRWIEHDADRREHVARLLYLIRFSRLTDSFITEMIDKKEWISSDCGTLMKEAKKRGKSCPDRVCDDAHRLIFSIGAGAYGEPSLELYDPKTNCWTRCPNQEPFNGTSVAVVEQKIYFLGGWRQSLSSYPNCSTVDVYPFKSVEEEQCTYSVFDTAMLEWTEIPSMHTIRADMAVGVIDGKIYIAGGDYGRPYVKWLDSTEVYDSETRVWTKLSSLSKSRADGASCVLNGKLYVIGGQSMREISRRRGWQGVIIDQVVETNNDGECYNPETDCWTPICPMKYRRKSCAAAVLNGKIYVVGGCDDNYNDLDCVERYDPATDTWTTLKSTQRARSSATLAVSCGKLFAFGGCKGAKSTVEMYCPDTDTWVDRAHMILQPDEVYVGTLPIPATFPSRLADVKR